MQFRFLFLTLCLPSPLGRKLQRGTSITVLQVAKILLLPAFISTTTTDCCVFIFISFFTIVGSVILVHSIL